VSETSSSDYTAAITGDCETTGATNLVAGTAKACTITNTYVPPTPTPTPTVSSYSSSGGTHYGCKDQNALNYEYFAASNPALCVYTATSTTTIVTPRLPNTGINDDQGVTKAEAIATFHRSLGNGSRGDDVIALQNALEQKGLLIIPQGVTKGFFGILTRGAVIKYQAGTSLPTIGVFGPLTRAKLISELGE
jgi:hypothetical protein